MRAAERLRGWVDALLDFSAAAHRSLDPDGQPTDLAALTADTASKFRSAAEHGRSANRCPRDRSGIGNRLSACPAGTGRDRSPRHD